MENTTESRKPSRHRILLPPKGRTVISNAAFDVDAFVHASGDGFGNTAPLRSDTGARHGCHLSGSRTSRRCRKADPKGEEARQREMKRRKKEAKKAEKEAKKTYSSIKSQLLRTGDKESVR